MGSVDSIHTPILNANNPDLTQLKNHGRHKIKGKAEVEETLVGGHEEGANKNPL